ncbi:FecR domain-containing protein [Rhodoferax sp. U11-2br]|uniref:FecR domain-containing protein n=1 Tax=Rhodoferax sp. U11-2br TaxID=2838878 RepID=UPI001BE5DC4A|nr:FecR domain-containing protein [Rhodoferax sp. U11-2br]MBT3067457.1 FecR domain-containing protein [Rhodoferax sp. U11-2br]
MSSTVPPTSPLGKPVPPEVAQRAVEWLVDLQAQQVSPTLQNNWRRWRAAHPDHERAWQRIETVHGQLFGQLHHLPSPVKSAIRQATLTPPRSQARRNAINTLTVLLFAGGATWLAREKADWSEWVADLRTAAGERRTVMLADGTTLMLNTASAVNVDFSASERRVRLLAGEVFITTAQDVTKRPFLVETSQGEARALGTRYTVRLQDKRTDVVVFEGAVRITPHHASWQAQTLQAGLRTSFTLDAITSPQAADQDSAAWTEGFLIAKGMRLADFLNELNRYSPSALSCDPAVANLRLSGSYPLSDINRVLETLSAMLSLEVETVTRFWGWQTVRVRLTPRRVVRS